MTTMKKLGLMALVALVSGGAAGSPPPGNATLKTCGGPLVQAHRGSRGEYDDNALGGLQYNKYDATLVWAKDHGYALEDIVFIGDDFADGGGDSHVRIKGMDHIVITDYKKFANAVDVLLK